MELGNYHKESQFLLLGSDLFFCVISGEDVKILNYSAHTTLWDVKKVLVSCRSIASG